MQSEEGCLVVRGRVEIDTRRPFRSVREAVILFGEKVLVGEIRANHLKEMQAKTIEGGNYSYSKFEALICELEETKKSLQQANEEGSLMASNLSMLRQELEHTKRELEQLKTVREISKMLEEPEIEEIKFVEENINMEKIKRNDNNLGFEFIERKKSVKFANPPAATTMIDNDDHEGVETPSGRKKTKKKTMIVAMGRLFMKKGSNKPVMDD